MEKFWNKLPKESKELKIKTNVFCFMYSSEIKEVVEYLKFNYLKK